ncbi:hypothetical protein CFOL_v3_30391 [Cephalotus follicularis]|uniref:Uncharacterized protein n=1 Tax=Cephalotus follicularis TaxID=3775 RepID=A0A1Q3D3D3_CEPFO|nr:hypothetical protein CFOL_v3_30391 [Cephalotus follicularis]
MADLLKRAERYVNAEEEMVSRKQKTPWSGHQEERREHSGNAPERRDKRKERSDLSKEDLGHKLSRQEGTSRGGAPIPSYNTFSPSWTHVPEYLLRSKIKSLSSGLRS